MIATMMLLLTINISNVAAYEKKDSSEPTRIEMDKNNLFGNEFERSISPPIIEANLHASIKAIEVILYNRGSYDFNSIMGYDSYTSSTSVVINTNLPMYTKLDGTNIYQGRELSDGDRMWLNYYYLPYVARSDTYAELDSVVFDGNNQRLSEEQRIQLQAQLNNGTPLPPEGGRITNEF